MYKQFKEKETIMLVTLYTLYAVFVNTCELSVYNMWTDHYLYHHRTQIKCLIVHNQGQLILFRFLPTADHQYSLYCLLTGVSATQDVVAIL